MARGAIHFLPGGHKSNATLHNRFWTSSDLERILDAGLNVIKSCCQGVIILSKNKYICKQDRLKVV